MGEWGECVEVSAKAREERGDELTSWLLSVHACTHQEPAEDAAGALEMSCRQQHAATSCLVT